MKEITKLLDKNDSDLLKHALDMADRASAELLKNFRKDEPVQRGTVKDVKLVYDTVSDRIIRDSLESKYPDHSFVTEETGMVKKDKEFFWIIDPLDGTGNFASQNPFFSVSIALWKNNLPFLGIIDAPMMRERFIAIKGIGAFHADFLRDSLKKVHVSEIEKKNNAYGVYCEGGLENKKRSLYLLTHYFMQLRDVRKLGSAAIELAFVGTGRSESYMTTSISLWDIAAGIIFVSEAGGDILHFDGTPYEWSEFDPCRKFDLLATNGRVKIELDG